MNETRHTAGSRRSLSYYEQLVKDLLADGVARTPTEIVNALAGTVSFTERTQMSRAVMSAIPALRERELVIKLMYTVPQRWGPGVPVERYVDWATIGPVCMSCWKQHWGEDAEEGVVPPQVTGFPAQYCSFCRVRQNHGTYMSLTEISERKAKLAG